MASIITSEYLIGRLLALLPTARVGYTCAMDVYDFDGTLYRGDSTADFLKFCLRRHPRTALTLPRTGAAAIACMGLHAIDKTHFKGSLYRFLAQVPDIDREVERFWRVHEHNIGGPCRPRRGDLVISASPEFLLRRPCERRGFELIASRVDPHTGRVLGPNCSGAEKIERLRERHPSAHIERFYSDSHNDEPFAAFADQAFLVSIPHNSIVPWPHK